ncbi:asparaginase [Actinokineospora sp. G85]|uniref:asparaginase n=1 Tax=Actinokineospora sp. G85 TaxID=3406626 RepID=UPI003C72ED9A
MPKLLLIATGDALAQVRHSTPPRVAPAAELLALAPADARGLDLTVEPSWDTTPGSQLAIARHIRSALLDDAHDAVVVSHGLDTVEETAFLTDLLLAEAADLGSVVFTGALHALDDPATDGPLNLRAAVAAALDPVTAGLGALLCIDGELHAARWAALADTTGPPALSSAPHGRLGRVEGGGVVLERQAPPRPPVVRDLPETDVALVKTYPGMPVSVLTAVVDAGARGLVVEGTGTGNLPVELLVPLREIISWDIPVVLASRAATTGPPATPPEGGSLPVAALGLAARVGVLSAGGLRPGHARMALMAALGSGGGVAAARDYFAAL